MLYKIMKNGKRFNTKTYGSYEEARKYAIRKVRDVIANTNLRWVADGPCTMIDRSYPKLSECGFSIKRIEA